MYRYEDRLGTELRMPVQQRGAFAVIHHCVGAILGFDQDDRTLRKVAQIDAAFDLRLHHASVDRVAQAGAGFEQPRIGTHRWIHGFVKFTKPPALGGDVATSEGDNLPVVLEATFVVGRCAVHVSGRRGVPINTVIVRLY
jgi:hypothetical protein